MSGAAAAGARYLVGIDLGTTNSAVAYVDSRARGQAARRALRVFEVPQLVRAGEVAARPTLPSFLYLPGEHELPAGALALPWAPERRWATGELAREQGALVPGRLVSSAKSWLCNAKVDRTKGILPWGGAEDVPADVERLSPIDAQARYLAHVREAWDAAHPQARLASQEVVVTVPASFDEVARELTVEAGKRAGLPRVTLLEEPQAAFYSWLAEREEAGEPSTLAPGETVLVCDVGGGTTDFTLIVAREGDALERTAVGDHLLLGGDNIDLALARRLEARLVGAGGGPAGAAAAAGEAGAVSAAGAAGAAPRLEARDFQLVVQRARAAKEGLLGEGGPERVAVVLPGRGSKLVASVRRAELGRDEALEAVLEGFFPRVPADAVPSRQARGGLGEWGLPFASDAAITRHLAAFLRRHGAPRVDRLLYNGGAFAAAALRARVGEVVASWQAGVVPQELPNPHPFLAVARGAAYYGLVRRGQGRRVRGGAGHSYYVEVGAPPGRALRAGEVAVLCVTPRGMEEGTEVALDEAPVSVRANRPVRFRLFTASARDDAAGEVAVVAGEDLVELPPIVTVIRHGRPSVQAIVPVRPRARLSEIGTLELSLGGERGEGPWSLTFDLRGEVEVAAEGAAASSPAPASPPAAASAGAAAGVGAGAAGANAGEAASPGAAEGSGAPAQVASAEARAAGAATPDGATPATGTDEATAAALSEGAARSELDADRLAAAVRAIRLTYGLDAPADKHEKPPPAPALVKELERRLGADRNRWSTATCRALWEPLREAFVHRGRSAEHEARWLNLSGFLLRPGFGDGLDEWRVRETWRAFLAPSSFEKDERCRVETWILWRRVAGGLKRGQQGELVKRVLPRLLPQPGKKAWRAPPSAHEAVEMWRCAGSLERIQAGLKQQLGDALLARVVRNAGPKAAPMEWAFWTLGRLGARAPLYGPANEVVPRAVATRWVEALRALDWAQAGAHEHEVAFAVAQLARCTGDRARDLDDAVRLATADRLSATPHGAHLASLVTEATALDAEEERSAFGDALPAGLVLASAAALQRDAG